MPCSSNVPVIFRVIPDLTSSESVEKIAGLETVQVEFTAFQTPKRGFPWHEAWSFRVNAVACAS